MVFFELRESKRSTSWWLLASALTFVGVLSVVLAFLSVATYDDFCRGAWSKDIGSLFDRVWHEYSTLSGRWAAHALYALTFPYLGITSLNYNLLLVLSGPIWFAIFYSFLHIFLRGTLSWKNKAIFSAILTAIYWVGMPGSRETWYWMAGSIEYQIPFLFVALTLLLLTSAWVTRGSLWIRLSATTSAALLAFLVTGFSELCGVVLLGCLAIAIFLAVARNRIDLAAIFGLVTVIAIVGLIINLRAPGISVRAAQDFVAPNNFPFAIRSLIDPDISPLAWLGDIRLICLALFLLTSVRFSKISPDWAEWKLPLPGPFSSMAITAPAIGLVAVLGTMFAVSYAMGPVPPLRVLNLIYAALVIAWVGSLVSLAPLVNGDALCSNKLVRNMHAFAAILLPITLMIAPATLRSVKQLPSIAMDWRPLIDARDREIRERVAAGERDLTLAPIELRPSVYFWEELRLNPRYWRNQCMADYYGADKISVPDKEIAPPTTGA